MVVMSGNNNATKQKLTKEQRAKVKELMTDEGCSRAEAVAWVLNFEQQEVPQ